MNNLKFHKFKPNNCDNSNKDNWQTRFQKWERRLQRRPPSEYGYLNAHDNRLKSEELKYLQDSAKYLKVNLPITFDPNRHFGYEVIPQYSYGNFDIGACCQLDSFLPSRPPYIPMILRCLVNHLEDSCCNIEYLYSKVSFYGTRAKRILINLSNMNQEYYLMREYIRHEAVQNIALATLLFLRSLCPVLLLESEDDSVGHKNKNRKTYKACLHCSCFLMIHLLHIWEYSKDPITTLCLLSTVFGPILLKRRDKNPNEQESIDQFRALMMKYDYGFWYGLSRYPNKILQLFNGVTGRELKYLNLRYKRLNCR